tara:strand:- start:570 stop:758 length:189 start_codon:yes stop_codon:yes gene_type:complete
MLAYHSVILEAYRASLADWAVKEIDGREMDQSLIHHTAVLASIWANEALTEKHVVDVIETLH